jgi:hypothetical protein
VGDKAFVLSVHTTPRMQEHANTENEKGGENMTLHSLDFQNMLDMKT